ncbi:uncharacterized protein J3D65DRAFT_112791 [Phyllosticta citribraziliensis]|uniref:Uncharacterized protein n=1 Tax=Phyllosticta citribraziliensis TaxID=989973 RepID=A0ABR1L811_9PEZI
MPHGLKGANAYISKCRFLPHKNRPKEVFPGHRYPRPITPVHFAEATCTHESPQSMSDRSLIQPTRRRKKKKKKLTRKVQRHACRNFGDRQTAAASQPARAATNQGTRQRQKETQEPHVNNRPVPRRRARISQAASCAPRSRKQGKHPSLLLPASSTAHDQVPRYRISSQARSRQPGHPPPWRWRRGRHAAFERGAFANAATYCMYTAIAQQHRHCQGKVRRAASIARPRATFFATSSGRGAQHSPPPPSIARKESRRPAKALRGGGGTGEGRR